MKLEVLRLRNFRCYQDETSISFENITALIGQNDAGKSALMDALDIFLNDEKLEFDDLCKFGDEQTVELVCEFSDLPDKIIIDTDNKTTLAKEYLLNSDGRLEIHKRYKGGLQTPKLESVFVKACHPKLEVDALINLKIGDIKSLAKSLGIDTENIDTRKKADLRQAIWTSMKPLEMELIDIAFASDDGKKLWEQIKKSLPLFALFKSDRNSTDQDDEAQDPIKVAVKNALKELGDELSIIETKVREAVEETTKKTLDKLHEMKPEMAEDLKASFKPPKFESAFKVSLLTKDEIPINKRGSGVRRLFLLNFFRAEAEKTISGTSGKRIIYAFEEPETSQHPNNQKMLMEAFHDIAENTQGQVILTTHTPVMARLLSANSLRFIGRNSDNVVEISNGSEEVFRRFAKDLGVLLDHDVKLFIGVEGVNDINFLKNISTVLIRDGEDVLDLKLLSEEDKIIFITSCGGNIVHWVKNWNTGLILPEFHIFDRDNEPPDDPHYKEPAEAINSKSNCQAHHTSKRELENYLHQDAIEVVKNISIEVKDFNDIPELCAKALCELNSASKAWNEQTAEKKKQKTGRAKRWLNNEAVENMSKDLLQERDPDGELIGWLKEIKRVYEQSV